MPESESPEVAHVRTVVARSLKTKRQFFADCAEDVIRAADLIASTFRSGNKILLCGNGGSAADCQHIAGEFVNRFQIKDRRALPALALATDGGVLTCISNDMHFDQVFARQIEAFGQPGDLLVAISTSGTSSNIVAAIETARAGQMQTLGILGRDGGAVKHLCDLALVVQSRDTQRIQETHNLLGHVLCELVEQRLFVNGKW